jgi:hypothetical protein
MVSIEELAAQTRSTPGPHTSTEGQAEGYRRIPAISALQLGPASTELVGDEHLALEIFNRYGALHLGNLFQPAFLRSLLTMCDGSQWAPEPEAAGSREVETPQRAGRVLNLVLSRPEVLRWIERATGCSELQFVEGRVNRISNRPGEQLHWHDDNIFSDGRQLQMVINLGTQPFEGGEFLMRPKRGEILFGHSHKEPGSALIFRVDAKLEHCVRPLQSGGPRRVYAGCLVPVSAP